jgi:hypothetical protein
MFSKGLHARLSFLFLASDLLMKVRKLHPEKQGEREAGAAKEHGDDVASLPGSAVAASIPINGASSIHDDCQRCHAAEK